MEIGLIVKFGKLVPGREEQAIALFAETTQWFEEQLKTGYITYFEPFFYASGDLEADAGFWIIKGERDKVRNVVDDETFKWLTLKAQFLVDHLRVDWLTVGEAIPQQVERASKVSTEFAFVH